MNHEDQKENSFWFQILAYITRLRNLLKTIDEHPNKIIICERSIYTDKYVFAKMLYESGYLSEMEWKTYSYWFDTFKDKTELDKKVLFMLQDLGYKGFRYHMESGEDMILIIKEILSSQNEDSKVFV